MPVHRQKKDTTPTIPDSHAMRNELVEEFIVDLNKPALFLRKKEPGSDPSMTC